MPRGKVQREVRYWLRIIELVSEQKKKKQSRMQLWFTKKGSNGNTEQRTYKI